MAKVLTPRDSISASFMKKAQSKGRRTLTNQRSKTTFNAFERIAKQGRWRDTAGKPVTPATVTQNQLRQFVGTRIDEGLNPRTIQTDMGNIRRALHAAGRNDFADKICTNAVLGVPKGNRRGYGLVVDLEVYKAALEKADPDTRAMIEIQRMFGLRQKEMTDCAPSLRNWERDLREGRATITIDRSTKGDKTRYCFVPPEKREEALRIVLAMKEVCERNGGRVVVADGLKEACKEAGIMYAKVGLMGDNSSHSLRRAFCEERVQWYMNDGYSLRQAWGKTSIDVGHSDKRARWLYNNYLRGTIEAANDAQAREAA